MQVQCIAMQNLEFHIEGTLLYIGMLFDHMYWPLINNWIITMFPYSCSSVVDGRYGKSTITLPAEILLRFRWVDSTFLEYGVRASHATGRIHNRVSNQGKPRRRWLGSIRITCGNHQQRGATKKICCCGGVGIWRGWVETTDRDPIECNIVYHPILSARVSRQQLRVQGVRRYLLLVQWTQLKCED